MSFRLLNLEEFLSLSLSLTTFTFLRTVYFVRCPSIWICPAFPHRHTELPVWGRGSTEETPRPFQCIVSRGGSGFCFPHYWRHCAGDLGKVASGFSTFVKLLLSFFYLSGKGDRLLSWSLQCDGR